MPETPTINAAMELLQRMTATRNVGVTIKWGSAQWSSYDGTPDDFADLYRHHGIPASIEFWEENPIDVLLTSRRI